MEKLEWSGYPTVKTFEDTYNRFDRIPAEDRQTSCDGIIRAMHTRRAEKCITWYGIPRGVHHMEKIYIFAYFSA